MLTYSGRDPATVSWANVFTFSLMTWIPLSSDALSSSTLCLYSTGLRHSGRTKVHQQNNKIRWSNMFVWQVNMFQGLGHQTCPPAACNNFNRCLLVFFNDTTTIQCLFISVLNPKICSTVRGVGLWYSLNWIWIKDSQLTRKGRVLGKMLINVNVTYHRSPHIQNNSVTLINANKQQ